MNIEFGGTRKVLTAAMLSAGLMWASGAQALPSFGSALVPGVNTLSDDDAEAYIDADSSGTITAGDYFIGFIGINTVQPSNEAPGITVNELTAVYALEVSAITGTSGSGFCGGAVGGCSSFDLVAPGIGLGAALDLLGLDYDGAGALNTASLTIAAGVATDAWLVAFEDPTPDFVIAAGTAQALVDATVDGTRVLELGDTGAFISATGPTIVASIAALPEGTGVGSLSFNNVPINATTLFLDTSAPVSGVGSVSAPSAGNPFPIRTNTDITLTAVPEPELLALLGIGLLGLSGSLRRRTR